jgi:hypothetical protein
MSGHEVAAFYLGEYGHKFTLLKVIIIPTILKNPVNILLRKFT